MSRDRVEQKIVATNIPPYSRWSGHNEIKPNIDESLEKVLFDLPVIYDGNNTVDNVATTLFLRKFFEYVKNSKNHLKITEEGKVWWDDAKGISFDSQEEAYQWRFSMWFKKNPMMDFYQEFLGKNVIIK